MKIMLNSNQVRILQATHDFYDLYGLITLKPCVYLNFIINITTVANKKLFQLLPIKHKIH